MITQIMLIRRQVIEKLGGQHNPVKQPKVKKHLNERKRKISTDIH